MCWVQIPRHAAKLGQPTVGARDASVNMEPEPRRERDSFAEAFISRQWQSLPERVTFLASERVWCSYASYHMTTTFNHKLTSSAIFQRHSAARPAAMAGCPIWTSAHSSRVVPGPSATRSFEHLKERRRSRQDQ